MSDLRLFRLSLDVWSLWLSGLGLNVPCGAVLSEAVSSDLACLVCGGMSGPRLSGMRWDVQLCLASLSLGVQSEAVCSLVVVLDAFGLMSARLGWNV